MSNRRSRRKPGRSPQRVSTTGTSSGAPDPVDDRLPRGRHGLSREQVEQSQRNRMRFALADAVAEKGYAGTSVADVLERSGVGRETFYQRYRSKIDCFLDTFDTAADILMAQIDYVARSAEGPPIERFERAFTTYLDLISDQPAMARVFLVEVYAAGPEAMERRAALQARIVDGMAEVLGARTDGARFACEVLVAAVSTMVTIPLVTGDHEAITRLKEPVIDLVRQALNADTQRG